MNAKKNKMSDAPAAAETQATTATEQLPATPEPGSAENPLPPEALPPVEAELIDEADASAEAAADADAELDISDEDRQTIRDAAAKVFEEGGEPAAKPAPIDGPVPLLGKTQDDAKATAHAAGTVAEAAKPAEAAPAAARAYAWPDGFFPWDHGYTSAQIIDAAITAHQENKAYCESIGDTSQADWDQAPDWQCSSVIQGVCHAIATGFGSPEENHLNWMKVKRAAGWVWGVEKNPDASPPTHPCIMPYANLPEEQRKKNTNFLETVMRVLGPRAPTAEEAEEAKPRTDHLDKETGEPVYYNEFGACLFLAFGGEYWSDDKKIDGIELIPFELAMFFRNEPSAPETAGLMHLRLKLKTVLLPNEDPRRVELALKLFRIAINSIDVIEKEDGEKAHLAAQAANAPKPAKIPEGEGTFERDDERFDKSDIGKALDQRAV